MKSGMFNSKSRFNFHILRSLLAHGVGLGKHPYSWEYGTIG